MASKWETFFLLLRPVRLFTIWSKRTVLPGFKGLSLHEVATFFFRGVIEGSINSRASSIAFNFFLAIFPAIIFFFTLIPYIPVPDFHLKLMVLLRDIIPEHAFITIESTITDIIVRPRRGLLSLGFIMALYFSTNGISSIIEAFNMTVHTQLSRTFIQQRLVSIYLVIIISMLTVIAIVLITSGTLVLDFLAKKHILIGGTYYYLLQTGKWAIIISLLYVGFSTLYYYAPVKKNRFRFFSAGSILATFLTLIISLGFDYYISNFSKYNALYGSIGTLIVLLLWIYFNANILLIGFELNASIYTASKERDEKKRDVVKSGN